MGFECTFNVFGGQRSCGTFQGHDYDKIKFAALVDGDNCFGNGKPVILSFPTDKALTALGLSGFSELCVLKYPFKIRVSYELGGDGSPFPRSFNKI